MCGGVGSRFWPVSRNDKPKQFLDFFGTGKTLLQMTVERIKPIVAPQNIILVTNRDYAPLVREQLPEIDPNNILLEPARRNTAPCVCWAAHHILAIDSRASIVTLPSDHLVLRENDFRKAIESGFEFIEQGDRLLTLGIKPSAPNTGYGYIQEGRSIPDYGGIYTVKTFTEKPDLEMAEKFVKSGEFLWNAGIFLWRAQAILNAFRKYAPEIAQTLDAPEGTYNTDREENFIDSAFGNCPNISIDYAIMEKADNVYVKTVDFGWSDLGTWKSLYEVSPRNSDGNVTQGCKVLATECSGSVFAVEGDKIIVAAGLHDYIVADTENALLIYPVKDEQKIRNIVNEIKNRFGEKYT